MRTGVGEGAPRTEVLTVYAVGLFQGLALVAFPAAASVLTAPGGYDLSSARYGTMFVPQVVMAIAGSLAMPALTRRRGHKAVLLAGVVADVVAMVLLVASYPLRDGGAAYPMLLAATAALGAGFGTTLSSISTYAGSFSPQRREVALTALNVLLGLGTALSPLLIAVFLDLGEWWYLPLLAAAGLAVLVVLVALQPMALHDAPAGAAGDVAGRAAGGAAGRLPSRFWLFAALLVAYGVGETMFGNWGSTLLRQEGAGASAANVALAAFWASVTAGRLVIAVLPRSVPTRTVYVVLPWAVAATLFLVASTPAGWGVAVMAAGGLACSGVFPMTLGFGESAFPGRVEAATGLMVAAYQVGYGLAAFGGGALEALVGLAGVFRIAGVLAVAMALMAVPVAGVGHRLRTRAVPAD